MAKSAGKSKVVYHCSECGAESARWAGQCPDCGQWNSLTEFTANVSEGVNRFAGFASASIVQTLNEVDISEVSRLSSGSAEFDRVLGGGFVPGSLASTQHGIVLGEYKIIGGRDRVTGIT